MVEHVFGSFAKVDDPLSHRRRADSECHVLGVRGTGGVVVAADPANATGNEVGVARVLPFHEDAVAAKDRRRAVALGHLPILKIDLREDSEAAHDPGNRIPVHFYKISRFRSGLFRHPGDCAHFLGSFRSSVRSRVITRGEFSTGMPPFRFLVDSCICHRTQSPDRTSVHTN